MIAIAIIGILASLILTVAGSANIKARNAKVSVDIQDLSKGIAAFKQKFSVEPPSRVTLYEQASGWNSDPRSMGIIRQIWPQFDFTYAAERWNQIDINGNRNFNGDGTTNPSAGAIPLNGAECLVFFLGGVPATLSPLSVGGTPAGFSPNPADPFGITVSGGNRTVVGTNREHFTEFDASRLFRYQPTGGSLRSMNTYKDTLPGQQPYLYLSSYNGQGYDVANELTPNPPLGTFTDVYRTRIERIHHLESVAALEPQLLSDYLARSRCDLRHRWRIRVGRFQRPVGRNASSGERDNITNFSSGTLAP